MLVSNDLGIFRKYMVQVRALKSHTDIKQNHGIQA